MFSNARQVSLPTPGKASPSPSSEAELPRGECSFLSSEHAGGVPERCSCRSYFPDSQVRSRCGCGHQAWHHEAQPFASVAMEGYIQAVEETRKLKQEVKHLQAMHHELRCELIKERMAREELIKISRAIEARMYENMQFLKLSMDDRVEAVVDRTTDLSDQMWAQSERLILVDEFSIELENRLDRIEPYAGRLRDITPSTSTPRARLASPKMSPLPTLPPLVRASPDRTTAQLPIRTDRKYPLSWTVRVVFVPSKSQPFAFDPDSNGYRRCASRKLLQNLDFSGQDSTSIVDCIEAAFKGIIRGRPWMPMIGHRPEDESFGRMALTPLSPDLVHPSLWDHTFLEDNCISHDKMQGDLLYISLQYEEVTWNEIRFLPLVIGFDETCWSYDEELDGTTSFKSLDSEMMNGYPNPPPYSSRTHSMAPSKLDLLADSAAMLMPIERDSHTTHIAHSPHSPHSPHSSRSPGASSLQLSSLGPLQRVPTKSSSHSDHRFSSEWSSLHSFESEMADDEHRDKKLKLRGKQSMSHFSSSQLQQPIYLSGRSKRKIPVREKGPKEPLRFNVSNVTKWRPNILHSSSKGKEAATNS